MIADFGSGGNMDDPLAKAEFTEIKEAILADVSSSHPITVSPSLEHRRGTSLIRVFLACSRG